MHAWGSPGRPAQDPLYLTDPQDQSYPPHPADSVRRGIDDMLSDHALPVMLEFPPRPRKAYPIPPMPNSLGEFSLIPIDSSRGNPLRRVGESGSAAAVGSRARVRWRTEGAGASRRADSPGVKRQAEEQATSRGREEEPL